MIHATLLNSHASSLRGVDISMSSSEGTLQELDKLYPSDSPNQLAEEAIFNPTKYSLLNLQNLKQWARHVNQGTSSWCALTRNFGRGASKAQPKCQAFFIQREREPILYHPTEKQTPIYFKTNIVPCFYPCLFMDLILDSIWCIVSHGKKGHPCRHDRLRQLGDSQGQDLLEICWLWNHLLKFWIIGNNWNIEICWNMVWNGSKYMLEMEIIVDVWIIGIIGLSTVTIHKFSSRHLLHRASYSFRGGEFHDSLLHRAWKLMNLYTIHCCLGRWQNSSLVADSCEFTFAHSW